MDDNQREHYNLDSIMFNTKTLEVLEEYKRIGENGYLPQEGQFRLENIKQDLYPILEGLKKAAMEIFKDIPKFANNKWYGRFPAYGQTKVKDGIFIHCSKSREQTEGRLKMYNLFEGYLRIEYVAYPKTTEKKFQIEKIAKAIQDISYAKQMIKGLKSLPYGFMFSCKVNNKRIFKFITEITDDEWEDLIQYGIDIKEYFSISKKYNRSDFYDLSIRQVAHIMMNDLSKLSGIYSFLDNPTATLQEPCIFEISEDLKEVQKKAEENNFYQLDIEDLKEKVFAEQNQENENCRVRTTTEYNRNPMLSALVKKMAKGKCDLCNEVAPFIKPDGEPFLESHHVVHLANGGLDIIENVVALCPNCHRKVHCLKEHEDVEKLKEVALVRQNQIVST